MNVVLGLRHAASGKVLVDGLDTRTQGEVIRGRSVFVPDRIPVRGHLSSLANVQLLLAVAGVAATASGIRRALRQCDLPDRNIDTPASQLDAFGRLSIWLAAHRLRRARVLLLDTSSGELASRVADLPDLLNEATADGQVALVGSRNVEFVSVLAGDVLHIEYGRLVCHARSARRLSETVDEL